jgi:hypothetical protein
MTDLVARLRSVQRNPVGGLCVRAADRIERLEAALRALKALHDEGGIGDLQERDDRTYFMVCDALEGNDD